MLTDEVREGAEGEVLHLHTAWPVPGDLRRGPCGSAEGHQRRFGGVFGEDREQFEVAPGRLKVASDPGAVDIQLQEAVPEGGGEASLSRSIGAGVVVGTYYGNAGNETTSVPFSLASLECRVREDRDGTRDRELRSEAPEWPPWLAAGLRW